MSWLIDALKGVRGKSVEKVSKEHRKTRLDQCNACPKLLSSGQCDSCGCFVADKTKYLDEQCPIGKW